MIPFIPFRVYFLIAAVVASITLVGYVYIKGRSDASAYIITQSLKEDRRVVETATTARRHADVHNAVPDRVRVNDGFRRD